MYLRKRHCGGTGDCGVTATLGAGAGRPSAADPPRSSEGCASEERGAVLGGYSFGVGPTLRAYASEQAGG